MKMDVIVCVHNAYEETKACIESILNTNIEHIDNLIIVDDYSQKETKELLKEFQKKHAKVLLLTTDEQQGYTKSANLGLQHSTADISTLLNSDTLVDKSWAKKTIDFFSTNSEVGIMGPLSNAASYQSVPSIEGTDTQTAINKLSSEMSLEDANTFLEEINKTHPSIYTPLVHGFCFSLTKKCIETVGYFDEENFPKGYGEESDYCLRAVDAGFALAIDLTSYVYHEKSKSYTSKERIKYMNNGWDALLAKHSRRRVTAAIKHLQEQPLLIKTRKAIKNKFYTQEVKIKPICFYLPQFHPTEVNNTNWGEGFTEWNNVTKATPRFQSHVQPKLPTKFGFYDLRLPQIMQQQSTFAKEHGIHGFCFYYYRFADQRVLNMPSDNYENMNDVIPFCYCWANESWTKAWDGASGSHILTQEYDDVTFNGLAEDLKRAVQKGHYLTSDGKPVFMIYQVSKIPNYREWLQRLKDTIHAATGKELIIGGVYTVDTTDDIVDSIDFLVQFPPHRIPRKYKRKVMNYKEINPFMPERKDYFEAYDDVQKAALDGHDMFKKTVLGVCPDWDNTSRREKNAHVLIGSTPEKFATWLGKAIEITKDKYEKKEIIEPFIFINAWNEWAEGAVLEPSLQSGDAYIKKVKELVLCEESKIY